MSYLYHDGFSIMSEEVLSMTVGIEIEYQLLYSLEEYLLPMTKEREDKDITP